MAVVRMWLAGQEFDNLQFLQGQGALDSSIDGKVPPLKPVQLHLRKIAQPTVCDV